MKWFTVFILFMAILTGSFTENQFESHSENEEQNHHASEVTYHSHKHQNQEHSSKSSACDHYHVHCTSLCQGLVQTVQAKVITPNFITEKESFTYAELSGSEFSKSLYRPPIV